ncbi:MAG TPA: hypothetical protein VFA03_11545 [Acetobacteraceae bacterium]|nr:hypothetical protein [Acetobacteraceae bacterium]
MKSLFLAFAILGGLIGATLAMTHPASACADTTASSDSTYHGT